MASNLADTRGGRVLRPEHGYNRRVILKDPHNRPSPVIVYHGDELARYGFGHGHPFGLDRLGSFWSGMIDLEARQNESRSAAPIMATRDEIESFHSAAYVDRVVRQSADGVGFLDYGDTPAFPGVYEAAAWVVGSTLDAVHRLMDGRARRAFVPIAGLHHARRNAAGGFCVFNDCGVAIEILLSKYDLKRIAYVDIDAHHGDGVLYAFEENPDIIIADIHEDGRFLYPGTGGGTRDRHRSRQRGQSSTSRWFRAPATTTSSKPGNRSRPTSMPPNPSS